MLDTGDSNFQQHVPLQVAKGPVKVKLVLPKVKPPIDDHLSGLFMQADAVNSNACKYPATDDAVIIYRVVRLPERQKHLLISNERLLEELKASHAQGCPTASLEMAFSAIVSRLLFKPQWDKSSYRQDLYDDAFKFLCAKWGAFREGNPFAFFTTAAHASFYQTVLRRLPSKAELNSTYGPISRR